MFRLQHLFGRSIRQSAKLSRKKQGSRRSAVRSDAPVAMEVENLEERVVLSPGILAIGSDAGMITQIGVFDSFNGGFLYQFNPYSEVAFAGGVRTAVGYIRDINGNSNFPVIIAAPIRIITPPASDRNT